MGYGWVFLTFAVLTFVAEVIARHVFGHDVQDNEVTVWGFVVLATVWFARDDVVRRLDRLERRRSGCMWEELQ